LNIPVEGGLPELIIPCGIKGSGGAAWPWE
jgi:hypothetical protein